MTLNAIRAHLAEFGIVAAQGARKVTDLARRLAAPDELALPAFARSALLSLAAQLDTLAKEIGRIERQLMIWHRQSEVSRRLETIPGIGLITATALAASVPDPGVFKSGRQFAAWLGLVPRQNSSGGKERLGRVSKMGNGYLRKLLVVGATLVTRRAPTSKTRTGIWIRSLLERKSARLVTLAIANKTACIAWALLAREENYKAAPAVSVKPVRATTERRRYECKDDVSDDDRPDRCRDTPGHCQGFQPVNLIGTRYADFIKASGQSNRP